MTEYFKAQLAPDDVDGRHLLSTPNGEVVGVDLAMREVITRLNTAATEADARAIAEMKSLWRPSTILRSSN